MGVIIRYFWCSNGNDGDDGGCYGFNGGCDGDDGGCYGLMVVVMVMMVVGMMMMVVVMECVIEQPATLVQLTVDGGDEMVVVAEKACMCQEVQCL